MKYEYARDLRLDFLLWSGGKIPSECPPKMIEGFLDYPEAWFVHTEPVPHEVTRADVAVVLREWEAPPPVMADLRFDRDVLPED